MPSQPGAPLCPRCRARVYYDQEKSCMGHSWHRKCFLCSACDKSIDSNTASVVDEEGDEGQAKVLLFCSACYRRRNLPEVTSPAREQYVNPEDPDCCPRCGMRVFFAEQMITMSRKWHKGCFKCVVCSKSLDSSTVSDHENELYCKGCHVRKFGPKGYGYAGGAGNGLSMDTGSPDDVPTTHVPHTLQAYIAPMTEFKKGAASEGDREGNGAESPPRVEGAEYCPRCGRQVFIAEKKQAGGKAYHDRCYFCGECSKKLDSSSLTEKAGEIYCKNCYGKKFAPKGYGFGAGGGALQSP